MNIVKSILISIVSFGFLSQSFAIDAVTLLKQLEGSKKEGNFHVVYKCSSGIETIGFGETSSAIIAKGKITDEEALKLLTKRIKDIEVFLTKEVKVKLNSNQKTVLISLVYNIGKGNFKKSKLLKELNAGKFSEIPKQLKKWQYAGSTKIPGLAIRRAIESKLWQNG